MLYYDLCPVIKLIVNFKRIVITIIIRSKIFITILFYSYIATQPYYLKKNIILEILNSKEYIRSNLSLVKLKFIIILVIFINLNDDFCSFRF